MRKVVLVLLAIMMMVGFVGCGTDTESDGGTSAEPTAKPTENPVPDMDFEFTSSSGVTEMYQLTDENQIMSYMIKTKNGKLIMLDGIASITFFKICCFLNICKLNCMSVFFCWISWINN